MKKLRRGLEMQGPLLDEKDTDGRSEAEQASGMDARLCQAVRKAAGGDQAAFESLIGRFQGEIFRMVYYRTLSRMDAEDITQDVFIKAFRNVGSIREPEMFKPWLYRIALNAVNDFYRRKRLRSIFTLFTGEHEGGAEAGESQASGHLEKKEFWAGLKTFLSKLSAAEKEVFRLKYLDDLGIREIAQVLGKNESTVKTHLYRAVDKFRNEQELCGLLKEERA
jgi:RNA polymerase sigma-70 factor, ECF subfamily